jgi:hypothetical protein
MFYCLIWDSTNLDSQVPVFISLRNRMAQLYPQPCSPPQIWGLFPSCPKLSQSQSYITTDGQSLCFGLSTHLGTMTNFSPSFFNYFCYKVMGLLILMCSLSRVWDPRGSSAYFMSLFLRLTQPGGLCPFIYFPQKQGSPVIPPSIGLLPVQVKSSYITTDGQSASLSWCQAPLSDPGPIFPPFMNYFWTVTDLMMWGALSDEESDL